MVESRISGSAPQLDLPRQSQRYSEDFRRNAVRLVTEQGYTFIAAAKAVGVSSRSLRDWYKRYAPPVEPCGEAPRLRISARRTSGCANICRGPNWSGKS